MNNDHLYKDRIGYFDRERSCCFTGHRKDKLPSLGWETSPGMKALMSSVQFKVTTLVKENGVRHFFSGMANGFDLAAAECVMRVKRTVCEEVTLTCVLPYKQQINEMHTPRDRYIYSALLEYSDRCILLNKYYHPGCYRQRNEFMVDHSAYLIAAYNPRLQTSGSTQTVNLAKQAGLEISTYDINPRSFYFEISKIADNIVQHN